MSSGSKPKCVTYTNSRLPPNTTTIQHQHATNARDCQQQCQDNSNCNVFAFEQSSFAPSCTLGNTSTYTSRPTSTTNTKAVSGFCVENPQQVFYPPLR